MKTKICKVCEKRKSLHRFAIHQSYYLNKCKDCLNKELKAKRRLENPEKYIVKTTKKCKSCNTTKSLNAFRLRKSKSRNGKKTYTYRQYICKDCERLMLRNVTKRWRSKLSDAEKKNLYIKWRSKYTHAELIEIWSKQRDKHRSRILKYVKKQISEITDNYCLTSLRLHKTFRDSNIKSLILLCRNNIKLKRKLKQKKNARKENKSGKSKKQ